MKTVVVVCFALLTVHSYAQDQTAILHVEVRAEQKSVSGAEVTFQGKIYETNEHGRATIPVTFGPVDLAVTAKGYAPQTASLTIESSQEQAIVIELKKVSEEIIVTATRTDRRIEDQPIRVEVLDRDEIEEKMLMIPGDITMMLNEMGGLRVQATSPSLGAASVRIQGMRGRYTHFLSDGLPLFGQQVGGIGLLQIPPMDLGQVEVIKGAASALYGADAMGGVVNLVSRRPGKEATREFLINQTTRAGTDGLIFLAAPLKGNWSGSLLGGGHFQRRNDLDDDHWADMPGYERGLIRPRLFWDDGTGNTLFVTAGVTYEHRHGGTVNGGLPATGLPYEEALESRNFDFGTVAQRLIANKYLISARFAAAQRRHRHTFGEILERDQHDTLFSELSVRRAIGKHTIVGGVAFEADTYEPKDVPQFQYHYRVPGVFVQDDFDLTSWLSFSAGGRWDHHNIYGDFFSPRISALFRSDDWSSRLSWGQGFFAPTPLTEETEAAGLTRLTIPRPLQAEKGQSVSLDITKSAGIASYTVTFFGSEISHQSDVDRATYSLVNLGRPTHNAGVELLATFRPEHYSVTASYTYVQARKFEDGQRMDVPLTPRHNAGIVAMWEAEQKGRVGVELYYTGKQRLEANPYRQESSPYFLLGFLAEKRFGKLKVFINAENLTGVKQTNWDPIVRPTRAVDGRWTVDAWAPLEGRVFNGGIRASF